MCLIFFLNKNLCLYYISNNLLQCVRSMCQIKQKVCKIAKNKKEVYVFRWDLVTSLSLDYRANHKGGKVKIPRRPVWKGLGTFL